MKYRFPIISLVLKFVAFHINCAKKILNITGYAKIFYFTVKNIFFKIPKTSSKMTLNGYTYYLICCMFILCLNGCGPITPETKGFSYLTKPPLSLPVKIIKLNIAANMDSFPEIGTITFSQLLSQWANEHFSTNGRNGCLRMTVREATVQEVSLKPKSGIAGIFKIENTEKFCGRVSVCFDVADGPADPFVAQVVVTVTGEKYAPENFRVKDRRALLLLLYEELIDRLTVEADRVLPDMVNRYYKGDRS